MVIQDAMLLREKIINIIRMRGPSLPARIAKETQLSILFASAFLSELLSDKRLKITHMKVGSSPVYFIPGQEHLLENFSQYLKNREKDAFSLLKEKRFLDDKSQTPAIRVALRELKDFAVPFKHKEEVFWRYFTVPESEKPQEEPEIKIEEAQKLELEKTGEKLLLEIAPETVPAEEPQLLEPEEPLGHIEKAIETEEPKESKIKEAPKKPAKEKDLGIFKKGKPIRKKTIAKKKSAKTNDKFFNRVKEFLYSKSIEILDINSFDKTELVLRVKEKGKEHLLITYNKKKLTEEDIVKAHKKALEAGLKYRILSLGEPLKKTTSLMNALKDLETIGKLD